MPAAYCVNILRMDCVLSIYHQVIDYIEIYVISERVSAGHMLCNSTGQYGSLSDLVRCQSVEWHMWHFGQYVH